MAGGEGLDHILLIEHVRQVQGRVSSLWIIHATTRKKRMSKNVYDAPWRIRMEYHPAACASLIHAESWATDASSGSIDQLRIAGYFVSFMTHEYEPAVRIPFMCASSNSSSVVCVCVVQCFVCFVPVPRGESEWVRDDLTFRIDICDSPVAVVWRSSDFFMAHQQWIG